MDENLKAHILVVDDDPLLLETMQDILEREDFSVAVSKTGQEAVENIKHGDWDLVVTDIKMPGMSGIELLRAIKELDAHIPVIVITGFASVETAVEAIREGAYDYVIKPFEVGKLLAIIQRAIKEKRLIQKNKELWEDLEEANGELNKRIQQLFRLDEASRSLCSSFDLDNLLNSLVRTTTEAVKAKVGSLMLLDEKAGHLMIRVARGLDKDVIEKIRIGVGEGIPGLVFQQRKIISSNEIQKEKMPLGETEKRLYRSENFVSIPISGHSQVWGVLNISDPDDNFVFSEVDLKLLAILASQFSIALENSHLSGKLQNSYLNTLQVLASAMEAKCRYTRGHSERVAAYAVSFAQFLGLSDSEIKKLEFACGVHDIGKINIAESILNKPGQLDAQEWEQMRQHPTKGVEILIPLGILKEIVPLVRHHHEHYNGKGYPDGLRGEDIPVEAKIIALVDAYDAMTSNRPYRKPLSVKSALQEIKHCLGTQFDPQLGELFIKSRREQAS
jgi:response regulator RpfG family c-di-GMP phosphodiesterase